MSALERVVDISEDGQHLRIHRGFLVVERMGAEVGRVALDDIGALIVHAHGTSFSGTVLVRLAERGVVVVWCASNHAPVSWSLPISGHHEQGARLRAQWMARRPLLKRLWRDLVAAKIRNQAALLAAVGGSGAAGLAAMAGRVRSGDPDNLEAQAARRYWPALFGPEFRRERERPGVNSMLNYGYAVLRAATARSIIGAGLHPTIGLAHIGRSNDFGLVDDVMEPFRPLVDARVLSLHRTGVTDIDRTAKESLAAVIVDDVRFQDGVSPLTVGLARSCLSLARCFLEGGGRLELPTPKFGGVQLPLDFE